MYYYIVDSPQTKADQTTIASIRSKLIPEGIPGEFTFRTPGESAKNLAEKAIAQGFTTIVAIGGDQLINELAGILYDQPIALGIIPMNASAAMQKLIGYNDWHVAIQTLRHRKLALFDVAVINEEHFFLTEVLLTAEKPSIFSLHMNRFTAHAETKSLRLVLPTGQAPFDITGVINFVIEETASRGGFGGFFGGQKSEITTLLRSEQAAIQCTNPATCTLDTVAIAQTPLSVTIVPQAVRIVVARHIRATQYDTEQ